MSTVYTLAEKNIDAVARLVAKSLKNCGVCVVPTDTIYGIVALEQCGDAVRGIYEIKKRHSQKQFIRLISGFDRVHQYTDQEIPPSILSHWPGPLTIVVRRCGGGTIALRYPDAPFLNSLFDHLDNKSIVAPSANMSGEEDIFDCKELVHTFSGLVDSIVCRETYTLTDASVPKRVASTIIDITGPRLRIIREGAVKIALSRAQGETYVSDA